MIAARGLGRSFGEKRVLRNLDLDVAERELVLVTGPNGSGKSTLLALCAGLLAPTAGELEVAVDRGRIGYLAHEPLVYRELTALENLELYGRLYRVPERRERIGMLLERFGTRPLRELLAPAIHYAERGFPNTSLVSQAITEYMAGNPDPEWHRIFAPGGVAPAAFGWLGGRRAAPVPRWSAASSTAGTSIRTTASAGPTARTTPTS